MKYSLMIIFLIGLAVFNFSKELKASIPDSTVVLSYNWDSHISKSSNFTILDAAQAIFTGSDLDDNGDFILKNEKVLRKPGTSKERSILPVGAILNIPLMKNIRGQGRQFVVLLWEVSIPEGIEGYSSEDGFSLISIFPEGNKEPTDIAEVKTDKLTFFGEDSLPLLNQDDVFTVINHHADAGQPYYSTSLFHIVDGRLRKITEISTLGQMDGCSNSFRESISWFIKTNGLNNYPKITASVELIHAPAEYQDGCEKRAKEKHEKFEEIYEWDKSKLLYIKTGGNMEKLNSWNESHM